MFRRLFKGIHWPIVVTALLLSSIGLAAIYSASFRISGGFASRQAVWLVAALTVFLVTVWMGYRFFLNVSYLVYGGTVACLAWVLLFGESREGASRWIFFGRFAFQPSEFAKLAAMLALTHFLSEQTTFTKQRRSLVAALAMMGIPFLLILKQPDLGSSLVLVSIFVSITILWGLGAKYFFGMGALALAALPFLWGILKPYQQKRLLVFLNPGLDPIGASYTAIQSKIAVGSGFLWGKGWLNGTQTQLDFVPEHHTDFIFSVIAEEMGFIGAIGVLILFAVLIWNMFSILNHTTDIRARFLVVGIASMFFFQIFINIGMTIGIAPITGITLPFISYGGSSLITAFMALGLLVSIYKERSIF